MAHRTFSIPEYIDNEMKESGLNMSEWLVAKWTEDNYSTNSIQRQIDKIDEMIKKKPELIKKIEDNKKFIDITLTPIKSTEINFFKRLDYQLKRNEGDEVICQDILNKALSLYYNIHHKRISKNTLLARLKAYRKNIVTKE